MTMASASGQQDGRERGTHGTLRSGAGSRSRAVRQDVRASCGMAAASRSRRHARVNAPSGQPRSRRASRTICAAGRGRLGALGAEKPDRLCVPSQNGLMPDFPHRQSAIVSAAGIDLGAVLVDEPEVAADDQRPVPVGRDRRAAAAAGGAGAARRGPAHVVGQVGLGGQGVATRPATAPRRPAGTRATASDPDG